MLPDTSREYVQYQFSMYQGRISNNLPGAKGCMQLAHMKYLYTKHYFAYIIQSIQVVFSWN